MLGGFGGSYKKSAALKQSNKCQELIYKNNGVEECDALFNEVAGLFKAPSFVEAGANGMEKYLVNVLQNGSMAMRLPAHMWGNLQMASHPSKSFAVERSLGACMTLRSSFRP